MKALTVKQPWAWAILHGGKTVENRLTAWKYRGPLAIHAGRALSQRGLEQVPGLFCQTHRPADSWKPWPYPDYEEEALPLGAVIGVVDLVDVHPAVKGRGVTPCCPSPWAEEQNGTLSVVHLVLENPRPLAEPIPWKGSLGLWNLPDEVLHGAT